MNKKYVYIFSNTERSDLVKIGKTNSNPRTHARKLSNETGAIGHFVVEWFMEVADNDLAEKILFYKFRENHYDKEFFKIDLQNGISKALTELCTFFEVEEPIFYIKNDNIDTILEALKRNFHSLNRAIKYLVDEDKRQTFDHIGKIEYHISLFESSKRIKDF